MHCTLKSSCQRHFQNEAFSLSYGHWGCGIRQEKKCLSNFTNLVKKLMLMPITRLRYNVLPWFKANYPDRNYVWTQDDLLAHTAKKKKEKVQNFCKFNLADFWPSHLWPSSSPDLNPLDYAVWSILEYATNRTSHPNINCLIDNIREELDKITSDFFLEKSYRIFKGCTVALIKKQRGHIE